MIVDTNNQLKSIGEMECLQIKTTSYDCFLQQLMAICVYYCGEYQKLFVDEKLIVSERKKVILESSYISNLRDYYGIILEDVKNIRIEKKEYEELYLVYFDVKKYPMCSNIEDYSDVELHAAILYAVEGDRFILFDNFYQNSRVEIQRDAFFDMIVSFQRIYRMDDNNNRNTVIDTNRITDHCYNNAFRTIKKIYEYICTIDGAIIDETDGKILAKNIQESFSFLNRNADLFEIFGKKDLYISKCVELLRKTSESIRLRWYILLKHIIKNQMISKKTVLSIYQQVLELLGEEVVVKEELCDLITGKSVLKQRVIRQVKEYVGDVTDLTESVYEKHDGYTVLKLINYLEEVNGIKELNPLLFSGRETYEEFCSELFSYILCCTNR